MSDAMKVFRFEAFIVAGPVCHKFFLYICGGGIFVQDGQMGTCHGVYVGGYLA
jgi:hypothetical protein